MFKYEGIEKTDYTNFKFFIQHFQKKKKKIVKIIFKVLLNPRDILDYKFKIFIFQSNSIPWNFHISDSLS